ncbi:helix-turn-helix domain-containing protein [Halomonas alkaliantarctica]|nr:helix-turn-helix domain-containing protein [Halomonas alkaliantarctica]
MIKCHLSRIMGERKLKIIDVARDTGVNRGTITRLYHETASRVELEVVQELCRYFDCQVGDLFEYQPDRTIDSP